MAKFRFAASERLAVPVGARVGASPDNRKAVGRLQFAAVNFNCALNFHVVILWQFHPGSRSTNTTTTSSSLLTALIKNLICNKPVLWCPAKPWFPSRVRTWINLFRVGRQQCVGDFWLSHDTFIIIFFAYSVRSSAEKKSYLRDPCLSSSKKKNIEFYTW